MYYNPEDEELCIINLFDDECTFEQGKTIVRIRLLETIRLLATKRVPIKKVEMNMERIGFERDVVMNSLQYLVYHSLVAPEYPTGMNILQDNIRAVTLTDKGIYYLDDLMIEPRYYGNMRFATYMYSDYTDLMKTYDTRTVEQTYQGTKVFVEFLGHYEEEWKKKVKDLEWHANYMSIFNRVRDSYNSHCVRTKYPHLQL
jgi:hypothetical protein